MDDSEIARLRSNYRTNRDVQALCAALEQARKELDATQEARALLARAKHSINEQYTELHARIEAFLEKKL